MFLARLPIPALLAKELIELASKPRTYVLRGLYGLGLLALFLATSAADLMALSQGNQSALGSGRHVFQDLVIWQLAAVYLFLPLLIAPLVSEDEERGNLDILIVSGIGPFEFLLQKMASRLVGMGTLMLLALPLGGIAYCLGGVDSQMIIAAAISLTMACLQIGCWAIWCSAREATTFAAIRRSYLSGFVWLLLSGPLLSVPLWFLVMIVHLTMGPSPAYAAASQWVGSLSFYPFTLYSTACDTHESIERMLASCPLLLLSAVCAMWGAVRAMSVRSTTMSAQMLKQMKLFRNEFRFERHRRAQIIKSGRDLEALPADRPLSWREQRRIPLLRLVGTMRTSGRFLKTVFATLGAFVVWLCYSLESDLHRTHWSYPVPWNMLNFCAALVLIASIPALIVCASGLFAGERSRRSLELLLVLPTSTSALLADKIAGCNALAWLIVGTIAILIVGQCGAEILLFNSWTVLLHVPLAVEICWVYLQMAIWLALAISLRVRTQVRAAIITLAIIGAWSILLPIGLTYLQAAVDARSPAQMFALALMNPGSVISMTLTSDGSWCGKLSAYILFYGGILWLLRWHTLRHADALLGRLA
jgi:ABC-type transport system involved in multi-copper enzyme maturation permease subunit